MKLNSPISSPGGKGGYVTAKARQPHRPAATAVKSSADQPASAAVPDLRRCAHPRPARGRAQAQQMGGDGNQRMITAAPSRLTVEGSRPAVRTPGARQRPADLAVDGSYSQESLALRELVLREASATPCASGDRCRGSRIFGLERGQLLDTARPLALRVDGIEAPLDLLRPFSSTGCGGRMASHRQPSRLPARAPPASARHPCTDQNGAVE